jgi:hypothetical protein
MGMRQLLALALVLGLIGCDQWDEAAERAACNNANPRDPTKAQACYNGRKLAYDEHSRKLRNAEWR